MVNGVMMSSSSAGARREARDLARAEAPWAATSSIS